MRCTATRLPAVIAPRLLWRVEVGEWRRLAKDLPPGLDPWARDHLDELVAGGGARDRAGRQ
ncbi:hypothetical protein [Amycolatopsis sp. 3B14]|uniref:hypothetical protein n=1 Tax=Amycolatopsis sp. 3B14 TaxID=3243600 RepID=UPI003D96F0BE